MKKLLTFGLFVALSWLWLGGTARAQQTNNQLTLTVSPAVFELVGNPGDTVSGSLRFANNSDQPVAGFISASGIVPIDTVLDLSKRTRFDASTWVNITTPAVTLDGQSEQTIDFEVQIPEKAEPGSHYALITLKPGFIESEQTETIIRPELSATLFVTISGDIDESVEIAEEDLRISRVTHGATTSIDFRVRNTGNVHVLPAPRLSLEKNDEIVEVFSLQPQLILPNTEKRFAVDWTANVDLGEYSVRVEFDYGSPTKTLKTATYSFWVTPNPLQIVSVIIFVPALAFIIIKRKNVPRTLAVLRGHANYTGKNYRRTKDKHDLPKADASVREVSEIAKEIENTPSILGMPEDSGTDLLEEIRRDTEAATHPTPTPPTKKPRTVSHTQVDDGHHHTHITQTSASTIVRETVKSVTDDTATPIEVQHHNQEEIPTETTKKKTPSVKKKPAPAKKSTKKKTAAKKPTKKKATPKKPAKKSSTATK